MDIVFDAATDATNLSKHGISLALARMLDWPTVMAGVDARGDYRELREMGFGVIGIRYDAEVITAFRESGEGWQTRMNDALKDWLRSHRP